MNAASATRARSRVYVLPPTGVLEITGRDAHTFLQGQLTNDVFKVDVQTSQMSAWCNARGRVIATLRLIDAGECLLLLLPLDQVQHVAERLRRFILRADVAIAARDDAMRGVGMRNGEARGRFHELGFEPPAATNAASLADGAVVVRVPGAGERYEIYERSKSSQMQELVKESSSGEDAGDWRAGNTAAGLPVVHAPNRERFLPQMLNMDLTGDVSFRKGCYTGQEIIARTQNLGRVKRRMRRFEAEAPAVPGDPLFADGSPAGWIVEVASVDAGTELLAVVPTAVRDHELSAAESGNPSLRELPLPYSIDP
ncbi:folate-binding protein YgfZ [soil metagenome]